MKNLLKTELPERFTNAVTKLYDAFHGNTLYALDCCACAVGNICDNNGDWSDVFGAGNSKYNSFEEEIDRCKKYSLSDYYKGLDLINKTGYKPEELFQVEIIFLKETNPTENKETQFKGLCTVIEYLCELDNIPNILDYQSLFEEENETKLLQLT